MTGSGRGEGLEAGGPSGSGRWAGGGAGRSVGWGAWSWCAALDLPAPSYALDATAAVAQHFEVWRDQWSLLTDCSDLLPLHDGDPATVLLLTVAPRLAWSPARGVVAGTAVCGAEEWGALVTWRRGADDAGRGDGPAGRRELCASAAWVSTAELLHPSSAAGPADGVAPAPAAWSFCVDDRGRVMTASGLSVVHVGRPLSAVEHRTGLRLLLPLLVALSMVKGGDARLERAGWTPVGPAFDVVPVRQVLHPEDSAAPRRS